MSQLPGRYRRRRRGTGEAALSPPESAVRQYERTTESGPMTTTGCRAGLSQVRTWMRSPYGNDTQPCVGAPISAQKMPEPMGPSRSVEVDHRHGRVGVALGPERLRLAGEGRRGPAGHVLEGVVLALVESSSHQSPHTSWWYGTGCPDRVGPVHGGSDGVDALGGRPVPFTPFGARCPAVHPVKRRHRCEDLVPPTAVVLEGEERGGRAGGTGASTTITCCAPSVLASSSTRSGLMSTVADP